MGRGCYCCQFGGGRGLALGFDRLGLVVGLGRLGLGLLFGLLSLGLGFLGRGRVERATSFGGQLG